VASTPGMKLLCSTTKVLTITRHYQKRNHFQPQDVRKPEAELGTMLCASLPGRSDRICMNAWFNHPHMGGTRMSVGEMTERIAETSPRFKARIAGVLWLMVIVSGMSAFLIRSPLIVRGDAAATATNILASESLFRLAFIADLVAGLCYLGVTVLFYGLLKPVSRSVSLLAAFFGLAGVVIGSAVSINSLGALAC
jgi:small-conductance mechanosensitive channel